MRKFILLFAIVGAANMLCAQAPTWSSDIAAIMYSHCTSCHRPGGLAPVSYINYTNAYDKRFNIADKISTGEMPPWLPDPSYSHFRDERRLTPDEINKINAWVTAGAPAGDTTQAPPPPTYSNGSRLGQIDKTISLPAYTVPNVNYDLYRCFTVPTNLTQDEFITAIEVIPGDPSIVHHVIIYEDTIGTSVTLDDNDAGIGYTNFGGAGFPADVVGSWVPGSNPDVYPQGIGVLLHKNSRLVVQIHYPNGSAGKTDSTRINMRLSNGNLRRLIMMPALNHNTNMKNGPLIIHPNSVVTFEEEYMISAVLPNISVLNIAPHAHLICKSWLVFATTPQADTIPLLKINDWDLHWQGFYTLPRLLKLASASKLHAFATYDNTANNPHNPSSPPTKVLVGESTTSEMMIVYISYLLYQNGDENISLDSLFTEPTGVIEPDDANQIVSTPQLYDAVPNPATNETEFSFYLPQAAEVSLQIFDISGRLCGEIKTMGNTGHNSVAYSTRQLNAGNYWFKLSDGRTERTKPLVIIK